MRKVSASTTAMPEAAQVRDVHPDGPSASGGQQSQGWGLRRKAGGNPSKTQREANAIKNQEPGEPDLKREDSACLQMHRGMCSIPLQRVFFSAAPNAAGLRHQGCPPKQSHVLAKAKLHGSQGAEAVVPPLLRSCCVNSKHPASLERFA